MTTNQPSDNVVSKVVGDILKKAATKFWIMRVGLLGQGEIHNAFCEAVCC
jgi:hypothetical protein